MKSRRLFYAILFLALIAVLFVLLIFVVPSPSASNENLIKIGYVPWSLNNNLTVHGETIWDKFADYSTSEEITNDNTIKLGYTIYWGTIPYNTEYMSWEKEDGSYSSNSLSFDDLLSRWQNSEAVFKFKHTDDYYRVSFTIPKLENGNSRYIDLQDAWNTGELYQIIEAW